MFYVFFSQRIASLSGVGKDARQNNEGVAFETVKERNIIETNDSDKGGESMPGERYHTFNIFNAKLEIYS